MRWIVIIFGIYSALCLLVFVFQRRLIYFPSAQLSPLPFGFEAWRDSATGELLGYRRGTPSAACLFFIHGNGGNARSWSHAVVDFPGDIYVLEFPGYGERPGQPSEQTIKAAALAAFEGEPSRYQKIVLYGQSLGSGVTPVIFAKYPDKVSALVLITPFSSLGGVAKVQFPFLPTSLLLKDRYPLFDAWKSFKGSSYVLIAGSDEVIASKITDCYLREKNENRHVTIIPDAGHNTLERPADFWKETLK